LIDSCWLQEALPLQSKPISRPTVSDHKTLFLCKTPR
jgi:hypothetical protein